MHIKHFIFIFLTSYLCTAQTLSKQVIGTAGQTQSNSNYKVSWTTGEPVVGLMTASSNQLGNGYHPALNLQVLNIEESTLDLQLIVYPNPTSQLLYVSYPELHSFTIQLSDMNGKLLYTGTINNNQPLDVSNYTQGIYMASIEHQVTHKKNTYKIIKK
jgi:hypothetical protein